MKFLGDFCTHLWIKLQTINSFKTATFEAKRHSEQACPGCKDTMKLLSHTSHFYLFLHHL